MSLYEMNARLALEDGSVWQGRAFGAIGQRVGEVVFNTSLTGYQEILTDPSYAGQIVLMTAPQIGNTGINDEDHEARQAFLSGFLVRELSPCVSNWRSTQTLDAWLKEQGIPAISDIDTRAITRRLRDVGSLKGVISTDTTVSDDELIETARSWSGLEGADLVQEVTCKEPYTWELTTEKEWEFRQWDKQVSNAPEGGYHVVCFDFGIKYNILRRLATSGCRLTVVPAKTSAEEVLAMNPDGVFLSNGPGDPAAVSYAVDTIKGLIGKLPIFGICLGHQLLAQALGGNTYKMKFGHHGGNQPVSPTDSRRVEISAHNHNFAVHSQSLPPDVEITHVNLNDGCCEGIRHKTLPLFSIQYHPESAPGPHDSDNLFSAFIDLIKAHKGQQA